MKHLYSLTFFLLFSVATYAQVPNYSHTDCAGVTQTVHGALSSAKPLLIASHGLDCSICAGHAGGMQTFAAANAQTINVWGAMVRVYSGTADCNQLAAWENQHNWNDIWSFVDGNKNWLKAGTPNYYVIDPTDSTIAYEGANFNAAKSTALSLVNTVGLEEVEVLDFTVTKNRITLSNISESAIVTVHDLTGRTLFETNVPKGGNQEFYFTNALHSGIYLITTRAKGKASTLKISL